MIVTYVPACLASNGPEYVPGPVWDKRTSRGLRSGPITVARMLRKFKNALSLLSASTVILPSPPSCRVTTSKSVLIGGRDTPRTTWDQNLLKIGEPIQSDAQRLCASPVKATALPNPVCQ